MSKQTIDTLAKKMATAAFATVMPDYKNAGLTEKMIWENGDDQFRDTYRAEARAVLKYLANTFQEDSNLYDVQCEWAEWEIDLDFLPERKVEVFNKMLRFTTQIILETEMEEREEDE